MTLFEQWSEELLVRNMPLRFIAHLMMHISTSETKADTKRMLRRFGIENTLDILTFMQAKETIAGGEFSAPVIAKKLVDEIIINDECFSVKDLNISGSDLIDIGIQRGTEIGKILDSVLEFVIDETIVNQKSELIKAAKRIYEL